MKSNRTLFGAIAGAIFALVGPGLAADGHDHDKDHDHAKEKGHYEVKAPESVKEAWAMISAKVAESETALGSKKLDVVHQAGEQMEAALHTLEKKSDMVAEGSKTKLASALKQLDKAVDEMHHGAEDKNADAASAALTKLKGLLPLIEGLYPPGALK